MKKTVKIIAALVGVLIIAVLAYVANGLVGNPVSKRLAQSTAEKYLAETYADTDFEVTEVNYSFKIGGYYARISSKTSIDSHFSLTLTMTGKLLNDSYENYVLSGWNTWQRLDDEYRLITEEVFAAEDFPYDSDIDYGTIGSKSKGAEAGKLGEPSIGVDMEALEIDGVYDIREVAAQAGQLVFYTYDEDVSAARAGEILLEIREHFDSRGVSFYAIDFVLSPPKSENGKTQDDGRRINVDEFLYSDIHPDNLAQRVQQAHDELERKYAEEDKAKQEEMHSLRQ